jgi:hypothetical protein
MYNNMRNSNATPGMPYIGNSPMGYVRVLHAVPDAPSVDVYANDELIADNLAFSEYTAYIPVSQRLNKISIFVAGSDPTGAPVLSNTLSIAQNSILTVAAVGTLEYNKFSCHSRANDAYRSKQRNDPLYTPIA